MKIKHIKEDKTYKLSDIWNGRKGAYISMGVFGVWFWEDVKCVSDEHAMTEHGIDLPALYADIDKHANG